MTTPPKRIWLLWPVNGEPDESTTWSTHPASDDGYFELSGKEAMELAALQHDIYREEQLAQIRGKVEPHQFQHGVTCEKVPHTGSGFLHGSTDDTPYDVEGCAYCGRCHKAL